MNLNLFSIVKELDQELQTDSLDDYPQAANGLQMENQGQVTSITAAVDACEAVIDKTPENSLLIVHHGLFWHSDPKVVGAHYRKIRSALKKNIAIYSSHLPLDIHPHYGNNILLAKALGLKQLRPSPKITNSLFGYEGEWEGISLGDFLEKVAQITKAQAPVHHAPGKEKQPHKILVITGGAGSEVAKVAKMGYDTFITGEGPHWSYTMAEELGINLIYAGHYATETFGVQAIAQAVAAREQLPYCFIDHPTGL